MHDFDNASNTSLLIVVLQNCATLSFAQYQDVGGFTTGTIVVIICSRPSALWWSCLFNRALSLLQDITDGREGLRGQVNDLPGVANYINEQYVEFSLAPNYMEIFSLHNFVWLSLMYEMSSIATDTQMR